VFLTFYYSLRAQGIAVSPTEWLTLMRALSQGHDRASLEGFYALARAVLVKRETQYDAYDRAFATVFQGLEGKTIVDDELLKWLEDPKVPSELTEAQQALMQSMDLDTLRSEFEKRRAEQKKRHDGGNRFIGTGGTSPFGHGGHNPAGVRVGGAGGGRSAVQVASERRFENLRSDRVLDTRALGAALLRLRRLARDRGPEELDLPESVDKTCKNGGDIELVFAPPRKNRVKLLLLMDVGGSMDPHAELCERLFSAAHQANHFQAFQSYYFHNCVYDRIYSDIQRYHGPRTEDVLHQIDQTWTVIVVGDAWMSPYELTHESGPMAYHQTSRLTGLQWLQKLAKKPKASAWLNPEPKRVWHSQSIALVRTVFPMFELTLDGLTSAVDQLRGARPLLPELMAR
jgi:hypothetical protein